MVVAVKIWRDNAEPRDILHTPKMGSDWPVMADNASIEAKFPEGWPYSVRKACMGSRREARQAGKMQAIEAIDSRVRMTAPMTAGSVGSVP